MTLTAPPALGLRRPWTEVPAHLRAALEETLGSPVTTAVTRAGGFSPGVAARLELADGRRVFVKAVGPEPNAYAPELVGQCGGGVGHDGGHGGRCRGEGGGEAGDGVQDAGDVGGA
ncbi:hypothetical protein K6I34_006802, partial [Streptomyces sp. UNOC14_S4]|nr:hypothetical protein [Streptomyces sp. UNOC14_S4]